MNESLQQLACARALAQSSLSCYDLKANDLHDLRFQADRIAMRERFHDSKLHAELRKNIKTNAPLFDLLLSMRAEAVGAIQYPGIKTSGDIFYKESLSPLIRDLWFTLTEKNYDGDNNSILLPLKECLKNQEKYSFYISDQTSILEDFEFQDMIIDNAENEITSLDKTTPSTDELEEDDSSEEMAPLGEPLSEAESGKHQHLFKDIQYEIADSSKDQLVHAYRLMKKSAVSQLDEIFDSTFSQQKKLIERLARKLQRRIQSKQQRHWKFDLDEGLINSGHLSRLAVNTHTSIYKQETVGDMPETAITILLDNSGSMKGNKIIHAALCLDIIVKALERCGIQIEVLGFTTRYFGKVLSEKAVRGRQNSLSHIIYKPFSLPWRRTRHSLAYVLENKHLKENIDGEAVQWAASRLLKRLEPEKFLLVIGDGKPYDSLTVESMGSSYLEDHLNQVVTQIEDSSAIQVGAIGLGFMMNRFYTYAETLMQVDELEVMLPSFLENWLLKK